jgi:cytochrome c-L
VAQFHKTAQNPYAGDQAAIEAGEELYAKLCQACHLKDGTGRIGPNLVDDKWQRARTGTDRGRFEIIYAGGAGAMQAFGRRIDQDQILRLLAYLEVLREQAD